MAPLGGWVDDRTGCGRETLRSEVVRPLRWRELWVRHVRREFLASAIY